MANPPPTPEDLARWLLTHEAGSTATPEGRAAAVNHLYGQLRTRLVDVFGPTGFDAMWARAMFLAHDASPLRAPDAATALPPGVPATVVDQDIDTAPAAVITTFASFIATLFTFVGPPLGVGLLRQLWPALPMVAPDPETGDLTP